jgi:hypothetical protein
MKAIQEKVPSLPAEPRDRIRCLPLVTGAEREYWRRAVAMERARQRCGRPAPFPFQP